MQTPEERRASVRKCIKEFYALRIRRGRCVLCNGQMPREAQRQKCDICAVRTNADRRAWYARKKQEVHP